MTYILHDGPFGPATKEHHIVPSAAQELLQDLLACELIRPTDWEVLPPGHRQRLARLTDCNRLLDQLVIENLLTGYQAGRIRARKPQWLILGSYRILDRLGAGSLGVVFRAEHLVTREPAAIKILVPMTPREESPLVALLAERRTVAHLRHPNIIRVLDIGEARSDDTECPVVYYYVMEYVTGVSLEELVLPGKPLTVEAACDVAYQIAKALTAAHQQGLVHGDLKPSNVVVTEASVAKLLDFGLVRSFNLAVGAQPAPPSRPEFLAPEQADPAAVLDGRTDLYSLGATLFWCLTSKAPFAVRGDWRTTLQERATQTLPSLADLHVLVPGPLQELVTRLLAFRPADRLASARAVAAQLRPFRSQGAASTPSINLSANAQAEARPGGNVLVVDENSDRRQACTTALLEEELLIDEAADGKVGLDMALAGNHDILILAAEMGPISGIDLLRYLRQHPPRPHLKVVMLCTDATPEGIGRVLAAGADDYLTVPVDLAQFRMRVRTALHVKQGQDRAREAAAVESPESLAAKESSPRGRGLGGLLRPFAWLFGSKAARSTPMIADAPGSPIPPN
jgi:CheY-like chemotaxis protein